MTNRELLLATQQPLRIAMRVTMDSVNAWMDSCLENVRMRRSDVNVLV